MNTSMTINATAMWLLALYAGGAEEQGARRRTRRSPARRRTTSSRSTSPAAPTSSRRRLDAADHRPDRLHRRRDAEVEPDQHLQLPPAGGRRDAGAGARVRAVDGHRRARRRARLGPGAGGAVRRRRRPDLVLRQRRRAVRRGDVQDARLRRALGRDRPATATASSDPKQRRFRYGVQVNSLGLTEAQPENNVQRIVLEMLAVTLSQDARARAVQLPAWNEALGLPRPWDQQWSLRIQQVLAYESDLLEYDDLFAGSPWSRPRSPSSSTAPAPRSTGCRTWAAPSRPSRAATSSRRWSPRTPRAGRGSRRGEDVVVGVNRFTETEPSPLSADLDTAIQTVDPAVEARGGRAVRPWRAARDAAAVEAALDRAARRRQGRRQPGPGDAASAPAPG